MKKWVALFGLVLFCLSVFAAEKSGPTKAFMHQFLIELSKIRPFLGSETEFASEGARKTVQASLERLAKQMKTPPKEIEDKPGFHLTFSLMADHVTRTKELFDRGELEYARMRLNGTPNFCSSCHTQTPHLSKTTPFDFFAESTQKVDFENATFLFVTRRYDSALSSFNQLIRGFPKNNLTSLQLEELVRRKLAIFARIQRDPEFAVNNLNEDLKNKELPKALITSMKGWIKELERWKKEEADPASFKTDELVKYVEKNLPKNLVRKMALTNPDSLQVLRLSGLLYERLFSETDLGDQAQAVLYYLALCERSLSPLYWYSVSEVYLKECVVRYPKQKFSQKCYQAYDDGMQERFSGRTMPEGIRESIDTLKNYL